MTRLEKLEQKIKELERKLCCKVQFFDTYADFPVEGSTGVLYVDEETGNIYIWDGVAYSTADAAADDMLVSKTIYVDATYGDDTTGSRENANLPFLTIAAAVTAAIDGDTLHIYPGNYTTSASTTKALHIFCEDGVTWTYTATFMSSITNPQKLKWRFDTLKTTNANNTVTSFVATSNFEVDLHVNYLFNVLLQFGGVASTIRNHEVFIDVFENSRIIIGTYLSTSLTPISNIKINTLIKYGHGSTCIGYQHADNGAFNVEINNVHIYGENVTNQQIIGAYYSSDGGTTNGYKTFNTVLDNIYATITTPLPAHSNVFDTAITWSGVAENVVFGQISQETILNANSIYQTTLKNVISYRHGMQFNGGTTANDSVKIIYNINGVWKRGIPLYTSRLASGLTNSVFIINLDVVVEDSTGIYFGAAVAGSGANDITASNTIIVTGRIKTKKVGFPCITIQGNTNNTIVLKDLTLINDGTVSPIMTNYAPGNNINIQNVVTNSLVVDPLVTEIGQPIVRNINYK